MAHRPAGGTISTSERTSEQTWRYSIHGRKQIPGEGGSTDATASLFRLLCSGLAIFKVGFS